MKLLYIIALALPFLPTQGQPASQQVPASVSDVPQVCEIHHERLQHGRVRVDYGRFNFDPDWLAGYAPKTLFPNARQFITGGCKTGSDYRDDGSCVRRDGPKYQDVLYCQKCRDAGKAWLKAKGVAKPYFRMGLFF